MNTRLKWLLLVGAAALLPTPALADATAEQRIAQFTSQLAANPGDTRLLVGRALAYADTGRLTQALADLDSAAQRDGLQPRLLYLRGRLAYRAGDLQTAFDNFSRVLEVEPDHRQALDFRARVARDLGLDDQAASDFARLVTVAPEQHSGTYIDLARLLAESGETEQALALLDERMTTLGPISPLQCCAVELELNRGNHDAALERLATLDSALKATPAWQVEVAEILLAAGRIPEARAYLDIAEEQLEILKPTAARAALKRKMQMLMAGAN